VKNHAADQLHVKVPHIEFAAGHLPANRECLRQDVFQRFAGRKPLFEFLGLVCERLIRERGQAGFQVIDAGDDRHQGLDFTIVLATEDEIQELGQHAVVRMRCAFRRSRISREYTANFS
jgi:hypothetical protein